ncbi:MAG TPA: MFS transporter [Ktedonobacteraceae bacterium]
MSEVEKTAVAETAVATETGGSGPVRLAGTIGRSIISFLLTIVTPLKDGNFRLYFGGQMLSTLGDTFYTVALPWIILNNGGNAQELGIVLAAYGVPRLATILVGGMLSDRLRPRPVMLLADVARALLLGLMAFEVLGGHFTLWGFALTAAGVGIFNGLFVPASFAILPDILAKDALQAANAVNETMFQLANLLGYSLAGLAIARLPAGVALAVDALSFVASVISLAAMRRRRSAVASAQSELDEETESAEVEDAAETATGSLTFSRYLRSSRVLQILLLIVGLTFLTSDGMLGVALPAFVQGPLRAGAGGYGLLLACYGAGQLAGGLVAGGLGFLRHRAIIVLVLQITQALTFALFPLSGGLIGAIIVMALAGVLNGLINVMYFTVVQEVFPAQFMGRIWGVIMFATYGFYPLSVFIGGVITIHLGPSLMFFISGLTLTVAAVVGLLSRDIRALA